MSSREEKSVITQKHYYEIEWIVKDIFSYRRKFYIYSPTFSLPGSEWFLKIDPNGETMHNPGGWIGLYLMKCDDSTAPKSVDCSLGVKKVDGTVEVIINIQSEELKKKEGWGAPKFLKRSILLGKKSEMAPSGALTVTCTLRINDAKDCTSSLIELSKDLKKMFVSENGCDATLKVQNEEFPVHKSVLSIRSPVFDAMFQAEMKEKNTGVVDVVDCQSDSFKDFLVYIYSGKFENSAGDAFELYRIAHKYGVERLKSACVVFIIGDLSIDNALDASVFGHQFEEPELKRKSLEFIQKHFSDIIPTSKWSSLWQENPALANELLVNMANGMKTGQKT